MSTLTPDGRIPPNIHHIVFAALVSLGGFAIVAGGALALYMAWVVYLIIEEPRRLAILSHLMELASTQLRAAYGNIDGRTFDISLGEPVYWILLLFVAAILVGIVSGAAKALIWIGIELIRTAFAEQRRIDAPPAAPKPASSTDTWKA